MAGAPCLRNFGTREERRGEHPAARSLESDEPVYGCRTQYGSDDHKSSATHWDRAMRDPSGSSSPAHRHAVSRSRAEACVGVCKASARNALSCQAWACAAQRGMRMGWAGKNGPTALETHGILLVTDEKSPAFPTRESDSSPAKA